ncbi:MAG: hypothetical protein KDC74_10960 [Flavobacteriaceae bacterium]|nr:hypothetical protein [Flavobacteriaceae bacterium]
MNIKNIAVLRGKNTTIKNGVVTYNPEFREINSDDDNVSQKKIPLHAEIRGEVYFSQGIVSCKFKAAKENTGVLFSWDNRDGRTEHAAGLSLQVKSFSIFNNLTNRIVSNGSLSNFKPNEEISMRLEIFGSDAKLFINNILHCEHNINVSLSPLTIRITSEGKVTLYDIEVKSIRPKLFVVMQFTNEFNNLYNDVIIPIAEKTGFDVIRADEFFSSTPILTDIIKSIKESSAIIADITPDNPNVFYEIGYAHAINKPTILICDKIRDKLPFDVSSFRTLFYENSIAGKSKIEKSLKKYLENII